MTGADSGALVRAVVVVLTGVALAGDSTSVRAQVAAQAVETLPYDHIHLNVPEPAEAFDWYMKNIGGAVQDEAPNRIMYGSTRFMFLRSKDGQPSQGSAVDHIGWRVKDLNAKVTELKDKGATIETEPRPLTLPNKTTIHFAYVAGPSGARIELVQR